MQYLNITAFQEYAEEIGLNSVNLTDFPTPVIGGDESFDDDDMYTLDNIESDVEGNVVLCGSSANDNFCEIKLVHLPFDVLCDVAQMLSEYRVRIIGNLLDDAENE